MYFFQAHGNMRLFLSSEDIRNNKKHALSFLKQDGFICRKYAAEKKIDHIRKS